MTHESRADRPTMPTETMVYIDCLLHRAVEMFVIRYIIGELRCEKVIVGLSDSLNCSNHGKTEQTCVETSDIFV